MLVHVQTYDDTTEGKKVCTYYKLESMPVVLILDPITGQKMRSWNGMVHPERLLEVMGMAFIVISQFFTKCFFLLFFFKNLMDISYSDQTFALDSISECFLIES